MSFLTACRRLPVLVSAARTSSRTIATTSRRLEHIKNAGPEDFKKHVLEKSSKPVIVDFYADWCGPCRMLSPLLEKLTTDTNLTGGKELDLVTVNTDSEPDLAVEWKVTALPTLVVFKDGKPVNRVVGFMPLPKLQELVKDV